MADTATKKPVKKLVRKKKNDRLLYDKITIVPIGSLKPHPDNPNEGDVDSIAESLDENGMYRPIVVNSRNGYIAAGHHTWLAARSLGWDEIGVVEIDVDENRHKKIMLADNATADKRRYNEELLAKILSGLKDVRGTGYDQAEADAIQERNRRGMSEAMSALEERAASEREAIDEAKAGSFERVPLGEEEAAGTIGDGDDGEEDWDDADEEDAPPGKLEDAPAEMKGAYALKDDLAFSKEDAVGPWELPRIRTDMLMTWDELPDNLLAWAGSATKDWEDPEQWWLYNWGIDSTSGMRDISKVIIAFYAFDYYFENWWFYPQKFVTKALNSGIKYIVMPDFSTHTPGEESRVISIWGLYRSRWLARYFQEAGLKVIPNITWSTEDEDFLTKHIIPTLPKNIPLLALQIQTVDKTSDSHAKYVAQLQYILDTVKPKALMLYYGKQGKALFDDGEVTFKGKIKWVPARMHALADQAKKRTAKKTI